MRPMYLLFLDFDGVLIHEKGIIEQQNEEFSTTSMALLTRLLTDEMQSVDFQIVVSSMHRIGRTLHELKELFQPFGLADFVVGQTPDMGFALTRGVEIQRFLAETNRPYHDFIILDDEDDMGDYIHRLVQTKPSVGFDQDAFERVQEKIAHLQRIHEKQRKH